MKSVRASTDRQQARRFGVPPESDAAGSVSGMTIRVLQPVCGGLSGNPKPQEPTEVGANVSEWIRALLTSAGLPTTVADVESRAGLGIDLSRRMLALTLARSQTPRRH